MTTDAASNDTYTLFMGALDVSNKALAGVRDTPIVKDLVDIMARGASGRQFGVAVYAEDPSTPHDYYTVRIENHEIRLVSRGKDNPDIDWKVSMEYLREINDDPQAFIDNPLKLDLAWLKHRLRDAV